MAESIESDGTYIGLFILLFLLKFACGLSFGLIHVATLGGETPIFAFLTIPVGLICSIYMCCIEANKKKAKKMLGYSFQLCSLTYTVLWCL